MNRNLKIAIIGAGIGGLTTAIALQKIGFDIVIYEQSSTLGEVGAGITLSVNASRVFNNLGLGDKLEAIDNPTPHIGTLDYRTGERLHYELRDADAHGDVTRQVHRADLHALLTTSLNKDQCSIHLSHKLADIQQNSNQVFLTFANGEKSQCDLAIASDGLKSVTRQCLFSTEPAEFTGFVAWRGLVERDRVPHIDFDPHFASYSSENKLFARYPVRHKTLVNYVGIARKLDFRSESWNEKAEVSEVAAEFTGWHHEVTDIIQATPEDRCMRWALYSRKPISNWVKDRVCLLGDAAHPMTPFYGMGAAIAVEDGLVLARCLEAEPEPQIALKRYEKARLERGNMMQRISVERAATYMNPNPENRAKSPSAGLGKLMEYDPVTVAI